MRKGYSMRLYMVGVVGFTLAGVVSAAIEGGNFAYGTVMGLSVAGLWLSYQVWAEERAAS